MDNQLKLVFLNGYHQHYERMQFFFEQITEALRTDATFFQWITLAMRMDANFFEWITLAVQTDANIFRMDNTSRANGIHVMPRNV